MEENPNTFLCENTKPGQVTTKNPDSFDCKAHAVEIRELALTPPCSLHTSSEMAFKAVNSSPYCSLHGLYCCNQHMWHFACAPWHFSLFRLLNHHMLAHLFFPGLEISLLEYKFISMGSGREGDILMSLQLNIREDCLSFHISSLSQYRKISIPGKQSRAPPTLQGLCRCVN